MEDRRKKLKEDLEQALKEGKISSYKIGEIQKINYDEESYFLGLNGNNESLLVL